MSTGRWLTGECGTERLLALSSHLADKTVKNINQELGESWRGFQPWMSCKSRIDYFSGGMPDVLANLNHPPIVFDKKSLQFLCDAFASPDGRPLGYIDPGNSNQTIEPVDSEGLPRFQQEITNAYDMVSSSSKWMAQQLSALVYQIIPLKNNDTCPTFRKGGTGLSVHNYRGGIFLGLPEIFDGCTAELAINLAHEIGHQAVMVYQYADRILDCDYATPVYSAVRKTERPAIMSFHALVALAYMFEFTKNHVKCFSRHKDGAYLKKRHQEMRQDFDMGWNTIRHLKFTELGEGMMSEFRELLSE